LVPGLLPPEPFVVVGHKQRIVRGSDHFRFPSPVFVDDVVHARARLCSVELAASKKGTVLTREIEVWSTTGEKPAVTCRLALQYF
jgi:acyl dehydratase